MKNFARKIIISGRVLIFGFIVAGCKPVATDSQKPLKIRRITHPIEITDIQLKETGKHDFRDSVIEVTLDIKVSLKNISDKTVRADWLEITPLQSDTGTSAGQTITITAYGYRCPGMPLTLQPGEMGVIGAKRNLKKTVWDIAGDQVEVYVKGYDLKTGPEDDNWELDAGEVREKFPLVKKKLPQLIAKKIAKKEEIEIEDHGAKLTGDYKPDQVLSYSWGVTIRNNGGGTATISGVVYRLLDADKRIIDRAYDNEFFVLEPGETKTISKESTISPGILWSRVKYTNTMIIRQ